MIFELARGGKFSSGQRTQKCLRLGTIGLIVAPCIGGFRGGAEGAAQPPRPPFFFLYFQNVLPLTLQFCFENRFMKCSYKMSTGQLSADISLTETDTVLIKSSNSSYDD